MRPGTADPAAQAELDDMTATLLSVTCPECGAPAGKSCPRREGQGAWVLLSIRPPILAHLERIKAAIAAGATTADAVLAAYPVAPAGPSAN